MVYWMCCCRLVAAFGGQHARSMCYLGIKHAPNHGNTNISSDRSSILACSLSSFLFGTASKASVWDTCPSLQVSDWGWGVKTAAAVGSGMRWISSAVWSCILSQTHYCCPLSSAAGLPVFTTVSCDCSRRDSQTSRRDEMHNSQFSRKSARPFWAKSEPSAREEVSSLLNQVKSTCAKFQVILKKSRWSPGGSFKTKPTYNYSSMSFKSVESRSQVSPVVGAVSQVAVSLESFQTSVLEPFEKGSGHWSQLT